MPTCVSIFGIDEDITLMKGAPPITIRKEHARGKVTLGKDSLAHTAIVERDDQQRSDTGTTFHITEADFNALSGG